MSYRIGYVLVLAYVLVHFIREYATSTLVYMGMLWTALWLAFEWGGSLLIGRPVHEILIGWHIERGCSPTFCHHSSSG